MDVFLDVHVDDELVDEKRVSGWHGKSVMLANGEHVDSDGGGGLTIVGGSD